ncbi:hypothetical protein V2J09_023515, partial [Rumex salicifolius]
AFASECVLCNPKVLIDQILSSTLFFSAGVSSSDTKITFIFHFIPFVALVPPPPQLFRFEPLTTSSYGQIT